MSCCVSSSQFSSAVTSLGYPRPSGDQYHHFANGVRDSGMNKDEAAMFLTQIIHESGGLRYKEEQMNPSERQRHYGRYHGRGYIQLTHDYNYRAASQALGLDLMSNPDLVLQESVAWQVSFWFWRANVRPRLNSTFSFDVTTEAINGGLEPAGHHLRIQRARMYEVVCQQFGCHPRF